MLGYVVAGVDEGFDPGSDLVVAAVEGIPTTLPGEDGSLKMGHHGQMATVGGADACHVVVAAVGVGGIAVVVVLRNDVVVAFGFGQMELAFAVGHPDAKLAAAKAAEHHAVVVGDGQGEEGALKLVAVVV